MNDSFSNETMVVNPYQTAFYIIKAAFSKQNIDLQSSLEKCNIFVDSDSIILNKIENGKSSFLQRINKSEDIDVNKYIEEYLKNNNNLEFCDLKIDDEKIKRITFIPLKTNESQYVMIIVNNNLVGKHNEAFMKIIIDTYEMILEKKEYEEKLNNSRIIDELTNLYNRNGYIERIKDDELNRNQKLTFAIIDLFRLKYVNDNFSHISGDNYISIVADLLKKVFMIDNDSDNKIYRIGGDEFVIMCQNKDSKYVEEQINLVNKLLSNISKNDNRDIIFSLNYGVSSTDEQIKSFNELYLMADERLKQNKTKKYLDLGIERRK